MNVTNTPTQNRSCHYLKHTINIYNNVPVLAEKVTVVSLAKRVTFRDAIRYANDILNGQVKR